MSAHYDLAIAGGGLGGAALTKSMADRGARVLVIEHERQFKDRVRGEMMFPWGYAEANSLGVAECLGDKATGLATGMLSAGWIFMPSPSECSIAKSPTPHRSISLAWRSIIPLCRSRCSERRSCGSHSAPRRGRSRSAARCGAVIGSGGKWPPRNFLRASGGRGGRPIFSGAFLGALPAPARSRRHADRWRSPRERARRGGHRRSHPPFRPGTTRRHRPPRVAAACECTCATTLAPARGFRGTRISQDSSRAVRRSARIPHISRMPGPLVR